MAKKEKADKTELEILQKKLIRDLKAVIPNIRKAIDSEVVVQIRTRVEFNGGQMSIDACGYEKIFSGKFDIIFEN